MALVLLERPEDHIALLRMNRPDAMNALSTAVREELSDHFEALSLDEDIRVIIITGNEKVFIAGADLKEMASRGTIDWSLFDARRMNRAISACPKPIISAINGFALGGGCELAMQCDILVAGDRAKFGQPEINLGVIPGAGGTQRLIRAVGKAKAMDMVLTGKMIDAQQAERDGLVARVFPADDLVEEAVNMGFTIAEKGQMASIMAKEAVNAAAEMTLAEGLRFERRLFHALFATNDQKEGMDAFLNKRKPDFKNA